MQMTRVGRARSVALALLAGAGLAAGVGHLALAAAAPAPTAPTMEVSARLVGPDGGWDYVSYDAGRRRMYVTRTNGVLSIDLASGQVNGHFADGQRTHGVVVIPGSDDLLVTNGSDSTARLVAAADGAPVASIPTGKGPDAAVYDPVTKAVWVMDHAAGDVTIIDPVKRAATGTVAVGGTLEFAAVDGKGRLYVNVEDKNEIVTIDTRSRKVLRRTALKGCDGPTGLVLTDKGMLIAACDGSAVAVDAASGRQTDTYKISRGADAAIYDAARERVYVPCGREGQLAIFDVHARAPRLLGFVATQAGARTGMVDPTTGLVYLPAAQYQPPAAAGQRPGMVPGSFVVLVMKP